MQQQPQQQHAISALVVGRESVDGGGPCPLSRHTVYLVRIRARGRQWVVKRRYRQFHALHQQVQDDELRAVFPPRSLCAQGGLACALETRQVRLAYYVNELINTKLPHLAPKVQGAVLQFLEGGQEEEEDDEAGGGVRKSLAALADEEKNVGMAAIEFDGRVARLSPGAVGSGMKNGAGLWREEEQAEERPLWGAALDAEGRAAYERLRTTLVNGLTVIKHGRRGGPKRRLVFCNEDATTLYWAASSSSSPRRRRQRWRQYETGLSSLNLAEVLDVREGTATFQRRRSSVLVMIPAVAATERRPQQSLSLITPARSLDLEALTAGDYRLLLDGFRAAAVVARAKRERAREAAALMGVGAAAVASTLENGGALAVACTFKSSAGVVVDGGQAKKAPPPAAGTE